ncbi:DNA (cytosine-5-)-methyltransferase [Staphylococcus saprophyticus]|uniref:DNA cytosine methyltransferase n=1 Tax=Staphylococcus saprophyticus TaxID=29385 RepID=UPI0010107356|nr:DNA (cytosine-5-)-methyltransferase [Staphylococcus saprophyticus]RXS23212.1 DNA (cytosine-5-)-methyltransferase [Staphylococcus saprophyticus]
MNFIDICSGIGGFRSALEMNGHNCLAFAEIDKYAKQSYRAIYDTEGEDELDDITAITDEHFRLYRGQCDIITGGFPCQAFSIAGNRRGFDDTRGTIFFHIARAIKEIQPSYVLLENVKGLFSHDKGRTFGTIIQALDELGYVTEWGLFNSKYWGVPQNRERVYILVTRKDKFKGPVLFDLLKQQTEVTTRLIDVLEDEVDEKYYLSEEKTKKLTLDTDLGGKLNMYDYNERDKVHSVNKVSPTLNTMQGGDRQQKIAIKQIGNIVDNKETFGGNPQRGRVYNSEGLSPALNCMRGGGLEPKIAVLGNTSNTGHKSHDVHDTEGISPIIAARDYKGAKQIAVPVLTPDRLNKRQNGRRFKEDGEPMFTLTSQDRHGIAVREATKQIAQTLQDGEVNQGVVIGIGHHPFSKKREFNGYGLICPTLIATDYKAPKTVLTNNLRIRKLTPLECWRLQGFTDEQFYKAKDSGVSNSQLYKQAGNSVTVNVVDAIVKCL